MAARMQLFWVTSETSCQWERRCIWIYLQKKKVFSLKNTSVKLNLALVYCYMRYWNFHLYQHFLFMWKQRFVKLRPESRTNLFYLYYSFHIVRVRPWSVLCLIRPNTFWTIWKIPEKNGIGALANIADNNIV